MSIKLNLITGLLLQPPLFAGSWAALIISFPAFCQISNITSAVDTTLSARVPLSHVGMQKQSHQDWYSHTINMDEAVQIAIDNNLHIKAAIAQAGIVIGELRDGAQADNPFIEGAFERNHDGKRAFTITAKQDITSLLFAGMKMRALASGKNEAILKATSEIYTLIGEVKRAYTRASVLHKVVELDAAEMSAARAAAGMAERQLSAGNINKIDNLQYRSTMLTGDSRITAEAVAKRLGIYDVVAEVLPAQKERAVKQFQEQGEIVAMAGDGVNDAPALARAHVGIAMGTGTDVAMESAGVKLVKGTLDGIVRARKLSRATMRNIKQNLFFAFVYNSLGVPIAAGFLYPIFGLLLSPIIAAAAMGFSSVSVIGNALRLRSVRL